MCHICTMTRKDFVQIEDRVRSAGMSVAAFLRRAKVDNSAWTRWKQGTQTPLPKTWRKIERAVARLT